jgi:hypothetical protein
MRFVNLILVCILINGFNVESSTKRGKIKVPSYDDRIGEPCVVISDADLHSIHATDGPEKELMGEKVKSIVLNGKNYLRIEAKKSSLCKPTEILVSAATRNSFRLSSPARYIMLDSVLNQQLDSLGGSNAEFKQNFRSLVKKMRKMSDESVFLIHREFMFEFYNDHLSKEYLISHTDTELNDLVTSIKTSIKSGMDERNFVYFLQVFQFNDVILVPSIDDVVSKI